ncbi:MAG: acyl-CoA dehydrogenase [Paracoccaceae bacterium]
MDFELSEEQTLLRESVLRFARGEVADAPLSKDAPSGPGYSPDIWRNFAEMGWLGLPFAEENGGLGGSPIDVAVLMEALGEGLSRSPYLSSILMAGRLVETLGDARQRGEWLAGAIAGGRRLAFAWMERGARYDFRKTALRVERKGDGFVLSGENSMALFAETAQAILILARSGGEAGDEAGLSLFLAPTDARGVTLRTARSVDGGRVSDIVLEGVELGPDALIGPEGGAGEAVGRALDLAMIAACAEIAGLTRRVVEMTREYLKTRRQFGAALSTNQVLGHRLADMFIAAEEAKSMADMAAMKAAEEADDWRGFAAAAMAKCAAAGEFVGAEGVQLHGGVGMTDELQVGRFYKRLFFLTTLFGDAELNLRRFAA